MKCIILAGGHGDRLWPLSRKKYPKQFISMRESHSLFQEAIARNIPFCDEFIIVTNKDYEFIVKNQMNAFQGTTYRCIYEEEGHKTTAAIVMACMELPLSELVFVVPASQISEGESYRDSILRAKELGRQGYLVTIGIPAEMFKTGLSYIRHDGEWVREFVHEPEETDSAAGDHLINTGLFLFRAGDMMRELKLCSPKIYDCCQEAYEKRCLWRDGILLSAEALEHVPALPIEESVFQKTKRTMAVTGHFSWREISTLEDLGSQNALSFDQGCQVQYNCENTDILSQCGSRAVVANGLTDAIIVNTRDAVYVGKKGESEKLRQILEEHEDLRSFYEKGGLVYRKWGTYEILVREQSYVVRKLTVNPGRTIYAHKHMARTEHWSIVEGTARVTVGEEEHTYKRNDVIRIAPDTVHQLSNIGMEPLVFIETSVGALVREEDLVSVQSSDLTESELGFAVEPFIKLTPAYKDYLWGGVRLKQRYGKQCEYDILAESWELSAHPAGQSIVASGRHKGRMFGEYLEIIGREYWGWKCQPFEAFPILVKLIDAKDKLSVQVHPNDEYAMEREAQYGKNEMWYIVDCEQDACIYCGFTRDVTKQEVEERMEDGSILTLLNRIPVRRGEIYYIPAGTIHAIGEGCLICEIQQSSDCTYRFYDYDRRDKYGNKRQLHVEKALQVLNYRKYEPEDVEGTGSLLALAEEPEEVKPEAGESRIRTIICCKYFECTLCEVSGRIAIAASEESFLSVVCLAGSGSLRTKREDLLYSMDFTAGESIFLPAEKKQCVVEGDCTLIVTKV